MAKLERGLWRERERDGGGVKRERERDREKDWGEIGRGKVRE